MKNDRTCFIWLTVAALLLPACASIQRIDSGKFGVVPISTLIAEPDHWEAIGRDINDGKTVVFLIKKGQSIPFKVELALPVADLEPGNNKLVFSRDTYLLISRSAMKVSPDGQRWANIQDVRAHKRLFGAEKKTLTIGFSSTKEEGTHISLEINAK